MVERQCLNCGVVFKMSAPKPPRIRGKFCSKKCYAEAQSKKVERSCGFCGKSFLIKRSDIKLGRGKFCSKQCHGSAHRGENSPNWKGDKAIWHRVLRESAEYIEWRKAVFARDNWTCQDCGTRGGELHAHHVFTFKEFPDHRFDVWNGVTLCLGCHGKIHPNLKAQYENKMEE